MFVHGRVLYIVRTRGRAIYHFQRGRCFISCVHGGVLYIVCTEEGAIYGLHTGGCDIYFLPGWVPYVVSTREAALSCLYTVGATYLCTREAGTYGLYMRGCYVSLVPPPPLRKHGRGPGSPAKTAVQRPPCAWTRPCMRVTHVTTRPGRTLLAMAENHIKTSSMGLQCVVQCCYEQNAPSQTWMSPSFLVKTLYRHPILHSEPQKQRSKNFLKTAVQRPPRA